MASLELENYLGTSRPWAEQDRDGEIDHRSRPGQGPNEINQGLEPTNGGSSAWKLLFASFLFEAILWGERYLVSIPDQRC
jgi:hypothetical protein